MSDKQLPSAADAIMSSQLFEEALHHVRVNYGLTLELDASKRCVLEGAQAFAHVEEPGQVGQFVPRDTSITRFVCTVLFRHDEYYFGELSMDSADMRGFYTNVSRLLDPFLAASAGVLQLDAARGTQVVTILVGQDEPMHLLVRPGESVGISTNAPRPPAAPPKPATTKAPATPRTPERVFVQPPAASRDTQFVDDDPDEPPEDVDPETAAVQARLRAAYEETARRVRQEQQEEQGWVEPEDEYEGLSPAQQRAALEDALGPEAAAAMLDGPPGTRLPTLNEAISRPAPDGPEATSNERGAALRPGERRSALDMHLSDERPELIMPHLAHPETTKATPRTTKTGRSGELRGIDWHLAQEGE